MASFRSASCLLSSFHSMRTISISLVSLARRLSSNSMVRHSRQQMMAYRLSAMAALSGRSSTLFTSRVIPTQTSTITALSRPARMWNSPFS